MNETDETYANAAHGMLKTGRQGKPLGQLDRIMAAGPAQQESFSKSPGTRGAPDRKGYPGGKARAGPASHPLHLSAGSGSHSKTAQSFAQTPRLPAKTVYKSWPAMGSPVYNSRTVPGEGYVTECVSSCRSHVGAILNISYVVAGGMLNRIQLLRDGPAVHPKVRHGRLHLACVIGRWQQQRPVAYSDHLDKVRCGEATSSTKKSKEDQWSIPPKAHGEMHIESVHLAKVHRFAAV